MEKKLINRIFFVLGWSCFIILFIGLILYYFQKGTTLINSICLISGCIGIIVSSIFNIEQIKFFFSFRGIKRGTYSIVLLFLIIVFLVFLYLINLYYVPGRIDATENQMYTFSDKTTKVLDRLDELKVDVKILVFGNKGELISNPDQLGARLTDSFHEYERYNSRVEVEYIDPGKNSQLIEYYGIPVYGNVAVIVEKKADYLKDLKQLESDPSKKTNSKQVVILYNEFAKWDYVGKTLPVKKVMQKYKGEEKLTSAISSVSEPNQPKIYWLIGHNEKDFDDSSMFGMSAIKNPLYKANYELIKLDLSKTPEVPKDCALLLIAGPTAPISDKEIEIMNNYLKHGGRAFVMAEPPVDGIDSNLKKLTGPSWGIDLGDNVVLEKVLKQRNTQFGKREHESIWCMPSVKFRSHAQLVPNEARKFYGNFITTRTLNRVPTKDTTLKIDGLVDIYTPSKDTKPWSETNLKDIKYFLNINESNFDLFGDVCYGDNPDNKPTFDEKEDKEQVFLVGAWVTKSLSEEEIKKAKTNEAIIPQEERITNETRLIVIGDSDWISNLPLYYAKYSQDQTVVQKYETLSLNFFLRCVDWLGNKEADIEIQPKANIERSLFIDKEKGLTVLFSTIILIPGILLIFGIVIFMLRRIVSRSTFNMIYKWIGCIFVCIISLLYLTGSLGAIEQTPDSVLGYDFGYLVGIFCLLVMFVLLIDLIEYYYPPEEKKTYRLISNLLPVLALLSVPIVLKVFMELKLMEYVTGVDAIFKYSLTITLFLLIIFLFIDISLSKIELKKSEGKKTFNSLSLLPIVIIITIPFIVKFASEVNILPAIKINDSVLFPLMIGVNIFFASIRIINIIIITRNKEQKAKYINKEWYRNLFKVSPLLFILLIPTLCILFGKLLSLFGTVIATPNLISTLFIPTLIIFNIIFTYILFKDINVHIYSKSDVTNLLIISGFLVILASLFYAVTFILNLFAVKITNIEWRNDLLIYFVLLFISGGFVAIYLIMENKYLFNSDRSRSTKTEIVALITTLITTSILSSLYGFFSSIEKETSSTISPQLFIIYGIAALLFVFTMLFNQIKYYSQQIFKRKVLLTKKFFLVNVTLVIPALVYIISKYILNYNIPVFNGSPTYLLTILFGLPIFTFILIATIDRFIMDDKLHVALEIVYYLGSIIVLAYVMFFVSFFSSLFNYLGIVDIGLNIFSIDADNFYSILILLIMPIIISYFYKNYNRTKEENYKNWHKYGRVGIVSLLLVAVVCLTLYGTTTSSGKVIKYNFDMSEEEGIEISSYSKTILRGLNQNILITSVFPKNILEQYDPANRIGERLVKLLKSYDSYSDKLKVRYLDPNTEQILIRKYYQFYEITPGPENIGIIIEKVPNSNKSLIEDLKDGDSLPKENSRFLPLRELFFQEMSIEKTAPKEFIGEEKITGKIQSMFVEKTSIAFLDGHGEKLFDDINKDGMSRIKDALEMDNFEFVRIEANVDNHIPKECKVLVVAGPILPFTEETIKTVDDFLLKGGRLLLLTDPKDSRNTSNVDKLTEKWGAKLDASGHILELADEVVFGKTEKRAGVVHMVNLLEHEITKPIIQHKDRIIFNLTRAIYPNIQPKDDIKFQPILQTSANAGIGSEAVDENKPEAKYNSKIDQQGGPYNIGVTITKPVRNIENPISDETRIVIFGDSDFIQNYNLYIPGVVPLPHKDLICNSINWLVGKSEYMSIRPRIVTERSLYLSSAEGIFVLVTSSIFIPLVIGVIGILIIVMRKKKK